MTLNASIMLNRIEQVLNDAQMVMDPVEVQATLAGFVAGGLTLDEKSWRKPFCELCNDNEKLPEPVSEVVLQVYRSVIHQLVNEEFSFKPLLLDDEEYDLEVRLEDLSLWAQAFLSSLAMTCQELNQAPDDIKEMIEDIAAISQVTSDDTDSIEAETAYTELVEYVCIVVLNCFSHFGQTLAPSDTSTKKTLH